jgi:hypothetical protein
MRCLWNVLDVNRHTSNMNHKANESTVAIVGETKGSLSLGGYQAAKNCVFSVPREARSNGRTFVT